MPSPEAARTTIVVTHNAVEKRGVPASLGRQPRLRFVATAADAGIGNAIRPRRDRTRHCHKEPQRQPRSVPMLHVRPVYTLFFCASRGASGCPIIGRRNEAFASVVFAWQKEAGWDLTEVTVNGGAIAFGHPLGAAGTRLMSTRFRELERTGGRYRLQTMCEGGGRANVTVIEQLT
jgi:hypothetical protein